MPFVLEELLRIDKVHTFIEIAVNCKRGIGVTDAEVQVISIRITRVTDITDRLSRLYMLSECYRGRIFHAWVRRAYRCVRCCGLGRT